MLETHKRQKDERVLYALTKTEPDYMRVLVADDHDLVRETIASFLESESDIVVSTAADLDEAIAIIRSEGSFDLVLLDYNMPGMTGLDGLEKTLKVNKDKPVAILSGTASPEIAERAIQSGAAGFVPKTLGSKSMLSAIRFMATGEVFAPFNFMRQETAGKDGLLTKRESEVLGGICEGKSNKEIARDYGLHEVTVKLHVKTLSRKLGARNRTHAAMIARDRNLI